MEICAAKLEGNGYSSNECSSTRGSPAHGPAATKNDASLLSCRFDGSDARTWSVWNPPSSCQLQAIFLPHPSHFSRVTCPQLTGGLGACHSTFLSRGSALCCVYPQVLEVEIKTLATGCKNLRLKFTKFDFSRGCTSDPGGTAYRAPPDPKLDLRGHTSTGGVKRKKRKGS